MKNIAFIALLLLLTGSLSAQPTNMDSISYSLGILMAKNLQQQGLKDVNADELARGFADMMAGNPQVDVATANANMQRHMSELMTRAGQKAKDEGTAFLAENAQREEVQVTESGLQYEILKPGTGAMPVASSSVKVHYHGTLVDGTVFDSSVERGRPAEFPLNRVIAGWTEGLQLMGEGAKYRFYIPYNLAYGERGSQGTIPPFATLIFDVELLEVTN